VAWRPLLSLTEVLRAGRRAGLHRGDLRRRELRPGVAEERKLDPSDDRPSLFRRRAPGERRAQDRDVAGMSLELVELEPRDDEVVVGIRGKRGEEPDRIARERLRRVLALRRRSRRDRDGDRWIPVVRRRRDLSLRIALRRRATASAEHEGG